jgi:hypothetical protein
MREAEAALLQKGRVGYAKKTLNHAITAGANCA